MTDLSLAPAAAATLGTATAAPAPVQLGTPAAPTADAAPAANPNAFSFVIPNTETAIGIDLAQVPAEIRLDLLKKGVRDYITNSVNQLNIRTNKANEAWTAYDAAMKADAMQTAVAKPTTERVTADLIGTAAEARQRLYTGNVRKQGESTGKTRETVDPLVKMVSAAVTKELYEKEKAAGSKRKFVEVASEVSKAGGGVEYLKARIAGLVAAGGDKAALDKFLDERYIKPAQMMLGLRDSKTTKDVSLLG